MILQDMKLHGCFSYHRKCAGSFPVHEELYMVKRILEI